MTERNKVSLAVLASLLLHLVVLALLMLMELLWPSRVHQPNPEDEPKQLEVTLVQKPTPPPPAPPSPVARVTPTPSPTPGEVILPKKIVRSFLDLTGLKQAENAPDKAIFESDRNSEAASELPASGVLPLPSQNGKKRPFAEFANRDYLLGRVQPAPAESAPAPKPDLAPAFPDVSQATVSTPEPTLDMPEPMPTPTPPPQDAFAIAKPTPVPSKLPAKKPALAPTPAPQPKTTVVPPVQPAPKVAQPRLEAPKPVANAGFQSEKTATKIDGAITKKGKAGVAAVGTPMGRYNKAIGDAIGSRWYYYINQRMDLITVGDVHIKFFVNEQGHVEGVRILSNTANDTFASYCIQSVTEAQIPPPPADVLNRLKDGRMEIDYHFNLYPQ